MHTLTRYCHCRRPERGGRFKFEVCRCCTSRPNIRRSAVQETYQRHLLLRQCFKRQRGRGATEAHNELPPFHSMPSSARASSEGGIMGPSAFVLRLTTGMKETDPRNKRLSARHQRPRCCTAKSCGERAPVRSTDYHRTSSPVMPRLARRHPSSTRVAVGFLMLTQSGDRPGRSFRVTCPASMVREGLPSKLISLAKRPRVGLRRPDADCEASPQHPLHRAHRLSVVR